MITSSPKRFEIIRRFYKKYVQQGRGNEALTELGRRGKNYREVRAAALADKPLLEIFMKQNEGNARSIKALNLMAEAEGSNMRFHDNATQPARKNETILIAENDAEFFGQAAIYLRQAFGTRKSAEKPEAPENKTDWNALDLSALFPGGKNSETSHIEAFVLPAEKIKFPEFQA